MLTKTPFAVVVDVGKGCITVETMAENETEARSKALLAAHKKGYNCPSVVYANKTFGCINI